MKQSAEPVTQRICRIVFQRNQIAVQIRPYSTTQMEWMVQPALPIDVGAQGHGIARPFADEGPGAEHHDIGIEIVQLGVGAP